MAREEVDPESTVTSMVSVVKSIVVGARKSILSRILESPTFMVVVGAAVREAVGKLAIFDIVQSL